MPELIALRFDLEAPIRQTAVLFLTSKTSVNIWSDFLALGFLSFMEGPGDIRLLKVDISEVETNSTSLIALQCC